MPKFGLTMTEGLLAEWRVQPGHAFKAGDILLVVETDKTASDVEAETDGFLVEAVAQTGEIVACGSPIARWSRDAMAVPEAAPLPQTAPAAVAPGPPGARRLSTPLARRLAKEHRIDLATITGSGPAGRIKARDVEQIRAAAATAAAPATIAPPSAGRRVTPGPAQRVMARRLAETKRDTPHFYLASEAEVSELLQLRRTLNGMGGQKLTLTHFVLAAVGRSLRDQPSMDRVWHDGEIIELHAGDVGLAVNAERGLFVPVVRGLGNRPLDGLARDADAAIAAARAGRLSEEQMQGGAVTVSNAGMHNVTYMTSIINPGQSSILGVASVREVFRPDNNGHPSLKRELGLVLSADHRLFDGVAALSFLNSIISYLEQPLGLLRTPAAETSHGF